MNTVIIGVDPGKVTGVARYVPRDVRQRFLIPSEYAWKTLEVDNYINALALVHAEIQTWPSVHTSVERFTMNSGGGPRTSQPEALKIIGALEWITHYAHASLSVIGASDAAAAGSRETLEMLGWWTPSDPEHHRNRAAAQVAHAMLHRHPDHWQTLLDHPNLV